MGPFSYICEQVRSAIETEGAKGCYQKSVEAYAKKTGIETDGLWAAVDGFLQGYTPEKHLQKLQKSWGGTPEQWVKWLKIVQSRPDCKP